MRRRLWLETTTKNYNLLPRNYLHLFRACPFHRNNNKELQPNASTRAPAGIVERDANETTTKNYNPVGPAARPWSRRPMKQQQRTTTCIRRLWPPLWSCFGRNNNKELQHLQLPVRGQLLQGLKQQQRTTTKPEHAAAPPLCTRGKQQQRTTTPPRVPRTG